VSEGNITRISAQEALRRIERGESLTDWARVRALSDEEVEAAPRPTPTGRLSIPIGWRRLNRSPR
jgi:hypothetical protein